jgi:hypothetical protein
MAPSIRSGRAARTSDQPRSSRELIRALRELEPMVARFVEAATDESAEQELASFVAQHARKGDEAQS